MEKPRPGNPRFPWGFVPKPALTEGNEDNKESGVLCSLCVLLLKIKNWFCLCILYLEKPTS
jgi:hypothetical protein